MKDVSDKISWRYQKLFQYTESFEVCGAQIIIPIDSYSKKTL